MKFVRNGDTVTVSGIEELGTTSSASFQNEMEAGLDTSADCVLLDLSGTGFVDCAGLGALVAARKQARIRNARVSFSLLNPSRQVRRILSLTRLDNIFPIVPEPRPALPASELDPPLAMSISAEPLPAVSLGF